MQNITPIEDLGGTNLHCPVGLFPVEAGMIIDLPRLLQHAQEVGKAPRMLTV